jgi:hypothetical protein
MIESRGSTMRPSVSGASSSSPASTLPSETPKPSSSGSVPSERPSLSVVANLMRAGRSFRAASSTQSATAWFTKSRYAGSAPEVSASGPQMPIVSGPSCWCVLWTTR